MPEKKTLSAENIVASRTHKILSIRAAKLRLNLLLKQGGRPYVETRLHRAPNESDRSWNGDTADGIVGRKDRAFQINDGGRIQQKINDYLFSEPGKRDGIDPAFSADVTASGLSVRQYFQEVSGLLTAGQWVWLHVDRGAPEKDPETGRNKTRSVLAKEQAGDRVYWNIWNSTEVVDWHFDKGGALKWLITQECQYDNADPFVEAKTAVIRTLWTPGNWTRYDVTGGKATAIASGTISAHIVPFICVGIPSENPWWFDDVESIQCALLNLESLNYENLVQTVFPQLVVPASMIEALSATLIERTKDGEKVQELVKELVKGLEYPFTESSEDSGLTRYLTPPAGDLKLITDNMERLRKALFEMVGLSLFSQESRQLQSGESKKWDHLDVAATLKNRALLLQEAEARLVAMSKQLDTTFKEYSPVWPQAFSVPNTAEDVSSLTQLSNFMELPATVKREMCKTVVHLLDQLHHIEPDTMQKIMDEIEAYDFTETPFGPALGMRQDVEGAATGGD